MPAASTSHLGALGEGVRLLSRHKGQTLALVLLAMVLGQLGPALEAAAGVPPTPLFQALFAVTGLLPLEMYLIPRWQTRLDAEQVALLGQPAQAWRTTFDQRWSRAFLLRLGLSVAVGAGLAAFIIPGLLILTFFGWAPLRVLLRGEGTLEALRWSQRAMSRHWPRVVQAALAILLVALVVQAATGWALERLVPTAQSDLAPAALIRLRHPAYWAVNFLGGWLNLWLSGAFLALFLRLERAAA